MLSLKVITVLGLSLLLPCISQVKADASGANPLQAAGLTKVADTYVLPEESAVVSGMTSVRQAKKQVDADKRVRKGYDLKIATARAVVTDGEKEYKQLEARLIAVTDVSIHNRMVVRMNRLVANMKEAVEMRKDLEEKVAKLGTDTEMKFVDEVIALDDKAEASTKKYEELAADGSIKSALTKLNAAANPHLKLGPTPEFASAASELKGLRSAVEAEAIPLTEENGVQALNVLVNGEPHKMMLDPGASLVMISPDDAEKLKLIPGEQDPTIKMKLADGNVVEAREMTLKSVRVGRFTLENISCGVMVGGQKDAPSLLGNSFLCNFVVKIDQKAGQLHLIEIAGATTKPSAGAGDRNPSPRLAKDPTAAP